MPQSDVNRELIRSDRVFEDVYVLKLINISAYSRFSMCARDFT